MVKCHSCRPTPEATELKKRKTLMSVYCIFSVSLGGLERGVNFNLPKTRWTCAAAKSWCSLEVPRKQLDAKLSMVMFRTILSNTDGVS